MKLWIQKNRILLLSGLLYTLVICTANASELIRSEANRSVAFIKNYPHSDRPEIPAEWRQAVENSPYRGRQDVRLEIWVDINSQVQTLVYQIKVLNNGAWIVDVENAWMISSGRAFDFLACTDSGGRTSKTTTVGQYSLSLVKLYPIWESSAYGKTQDIEGLMRVAEGDGAKLRWAIGYNVRAGEFLHQVVVKEQEAMLGHRASGGCIRSSEEHAPELYARVLQVSPERSKVYIIDSSVDPSVHLPNLQMASWPKPQFARRPIQQVEINLNCLSEKSRAQACEGAAHYLNRTILSRDSQVLLKSLQRLNLQCAQGLVANITRSYDTASYSVDTQSLTSPLNPRASGDRVIRIHRPGSGSRGVEVEEVIIHGGISE